MIIIGKPFVTNTDNKSRLTAKLSIDKKEVEVWFEVDNKFGNYLTYERSDAFVIGVLSYAMRNGHDITCKQPMSTDLFYQIDTYLIDAVYKGSKSLYRTKIITDISNEKLESAKAVGTGISCGIDSFHAISSHTGLKSEEFNVTHLAFNNVGSHGEGDRAVKLFNERRKLAKKFADEYNYEFVESNSNIHDVIPQNHFLTNTYTSCFAIFCLRKLYSYYLYASAVPFSRFKLELNENTSSGHYDLLSLNMFSISGLKIYSEGATSTRFEKTIAVSKYTPSYNYLNVCTNTAENCNKCEKCIRTLLTLDAINALDFYKNVFDIEYYKEYRQWYLRKMLIYKSTKKDYTEIYPILKKNIKYVTYLIGWFDLLLTSSINHTPQAIKNIIKRIMRRK